ncbi:hypothetical protein VI817_001296 [Penicillium citrinum]|nr:hypothetical protein VI817_001296 [Penicillium citrinum]
MEEDPPPAIIESDHSAGRRAREVYRYFKPERLSAIYGDASPSSSTFSSSRRGRDSRGSFATHQRNVPSVSPQPSTSLNSQDSTTCAPLEPLGESMTLGDPSSTLNSFAQLAALRLDVDRVFISVSDRDSQFIVAQAAQNSGHDKYDFLGGGVYNGCSTLDASSWSMCRDTIALAPSNRLSGEYNFLVSNDLSQDDRYKDLPFVQEEPKFRFYAGTPLTTESNINMGCFFVLDTKPHDEFTFLERETMGHMGMLIMDFLKTSRLAAEGHRATRLSHGLSLFVEGRSAFADDSQSPVTENADQTSLSEKNTSRSPRNRSRTSDTSSSRSPSRSNGIKSFDFASGQENEESTVPSLTSTHENRSHYSKAKLNRETQRGNTWTFRRAANLIRESLELDGNDGVVFVGAGNDPIPQNGSDSDRSSSFDSADTNKAVHVLALSTESENNFDGMKSKSPVHCSISNLDEDFLRILLHRYNKGRIWSIHRDGMLSSSDSEETDAPPDGQETKSSSSRQIKLNRRKTRETSMLNKCFPGATQVLFVPLWNSASSQWFGGFFCWNTVESNVFNPCVELSSLLGFGSSIMSECNRVDSLIADRQKGDFLGSISHELRSPLHGVLAAAEIMQGTELTPFQASLMETIDACGRTLLDTMNQVLDYSKIVSLERQFRSLNKKRGDRSPKRRYKHRSAAHLDAYKVTDVSVLAEEVVEGVCLGHLQMAKPLGFQTPLPNENNDLDLSRPPVKVDLNFANHDWVYQTAPGALRRIIMNIFSNSMKYTTQGQISLRLDVNESSESGHQQGQQTDLVTLTVFDTGKGISDDFLRGRLFVPFAQENTLASGSGLGLSIVRSLLKSLGGNINVQSQPGNGTTVKVTIPLSRAEPDDCADNQSSVDPMEKESTTNDLRHMGRDFPGRKIAIWGQEPENASKHPFWSAIYFYLTDWYGLEVVSPSSGETIDLLLAEEVPSENDFNEHLACKPSVLVMSSNGAGHETMRVNWLPATKTVNIIHRPFGPNKFGKILRKCLEEQVLPPIDAESSHVSELPERPQTHEQDETNHSVITQSEASSNTTPLTPPTDNDQSNESTKVSETKPEARILVVEDNIVNLKLMLTFLQKRKIPTLDSAENGEMAVAAVKKGLQNYDIIFMDISMPVMDGFEATRNIRAIEKARNGGGKPATIIALTGLSSEKDESAALESGMDLFLTKPVTFKQVTKLLNEWEESNSEKQG